MNCDYDLLPLEAVFNKMPATTDNADYVDALEKEINKSNNGSTIADKFSISLKFSNPKIPQDARDKVLRRFWKDIPEKFKCNLC